MFEIIQSNTFSQWLGGLKDRQARMRVVVMLCGGDKSSQARDIEQAKIIAKDWKD